MYFTGVQPDYEAAGLRVSESSPLDGSRGATCRFDPLILADANNPFQIFVPSTHPTPNSDFTVFRQRITLPKLKLF